MLLSESSLLLGTRDLIQCAAVRECPWASRFLLNLGGAFSSWIKVNRSIQNVGATDLEFYRYGMFFSCTIYSTLQGKQRVLIITKILIAGDTRSL